MNERAKAFEAGCALLDDGWANTITSGILFSSKRGLSCGGLEVDSVDPHERFASDEEPNSIFSTPIMQHVREMSAYAEILCRFSFSLQFARSFVESPLLGFFFPQGQGERRTQEKPFH